MDAGLWAAIRRLYSVEKLSQRAISKRLGIHRKTVWLALRSETPGKRGGALGRKRASKLDAYKGYLRERIKEYPEISGTKLLQEIRAQGYAGGHTILREFIEETRPPKTREAFLRIETAPGEFAQVDWANVGSTFVGSTCRKLSAFVMVLSYSRMIYVELTLSQSLEDFIACHINAFRFFGGVPKKCLYDNLKSVCLYRSGSLIQFNERFLEFAGTFEFEPVLCNVARGNEKGKVESGIGYLRKNFLAGYSLHNAWPHIQTDAVYWRDDIANVRQHATTRERPVARWSAEKIVLRPIPEKGFDCSIVRSAKATSQALIHFDGNRYSVPYTYAYKALTLKASFGEVKIFDGPRLLASHRRSYERGVVTENPKHYEGLLALKKQALASKTREQFLALGDLGRRYLEGLTETDLNVAHHLAKIMELVYLYGRTEVLGALEEAAKFGAWGAPYIQNIITQKRAARNLREPEPLELSKKPQWAKVTVEQPDLALYDELFEEGGPL